MNLSTLLPFPSSFSQFQNTSVIYLPYVLKRQLIIILFHSPGLESFPWDIHSRHCTPPFPKCVLQVHYVPHCLNIMPWPTTQYFSNIVSLLSTQPCNGTPLSLSPPFSDSTESHTLYFYPRPVLAFGYCRLPPSVCLCVCVCVNHLLVRAITCRPFKLESPNLDQKSKTPWLRSLLFWGLIDLELQGQI